MDCFHRESLDKYIKNYKCGVLQKLEKSKLYSKELTSKSDLLCMVLDYSPRIVEESRLYGKKKILIFIINFRKIYNKTSS